MIAWDDFEVHAPNTFRELWTDQDFTDVTLATVDDKQVKAHKVILSSCSAFFKNILLKNQHKNPLIYLKDIRHVDLEMVLKFIYLGECEVAEQDINSFITTGKELKIKGLAEQLFDSVPSKLISLEQSNKMNPKKEQDRKTSGELPPFVEVEGQNIENYTYNAMEIPMKEHVVEFVKEQPVEVDDVLSENILKDISQNDPLLKITQNCSKLLTIAPNDPIGDDIGCTEKTGGNVKKIKEERLQCDQCDYRAKRTNDLKSHKKVKHLGLKEKCDKCDATFAAKRGLDRHKQSIHEGVRFACSYCGKLFSQKSAMTMHSQIQHERTWS